MRILLFLSLWLAAALFSAQTHAVALQVQSVDILAGAKEDALTITLNKPVHYKAFLLENPSRLVIDLPPFRWVAATSKTQNYTGTLMTNLRYARFNANISRIVLDLSTPITLQTSTSPDNAQRIVTLYLVHHGESAAPALRPLATTPSPPSSLTLRNHRNVRDPIFQHTPVPQPKPALAAKASLLKPLIMIDAGHGGQDPGASGKQSTKEKHVTLRYARALQKELTRSGKFRAALTRADDRFIRLRERIAIAKRHGADLFISLHADSAPSAKAKGLSVYTLSEEASDAEAAALAQQENMADIIAGVDLSVEDEDVAGILIDLVQRDTKNKSIKLAEHLVRSLAKKRIRLLSNTHRFAGFAVLKAPDIPSALVEIGFLSNLGEERLINSSTHRKQVVTGLVAGISEFFSQK